MAQLLLERFFLMMNVRSLQLPVVNIHLFAFGARDLSQFADCFRQFGGQQRGNPPEGNGSCGMVRFREDLPEKEQSFLGGGVVKGIQ